MPGSPGSWPVHEFPLLGLEDYEKTSDNDREYNCLAWAARDNQRWWWPDSYGIGYWPPGIPRAETLEAFIRAYGQLGFLPCPDSSLEDGFEKLAIFARGLSDGTVVPTHAARQLPSGRWTSKMGPFEDIDHRNLDVLRGPCYGAPCCYLRRLINADRTDLPEATPTQE